MNKLVIVESPTKAKTISKFLGKDYKIESSFGHIRDLPTSALGVDVEHDFEPKYVIPAKAKKHVTELKKLASKAPEVILATDEDREGEAISWHLVQALGLESSKLSPLGGSSAGRQAPSSKPINRIVFHEITKSAIEKALENPRDIDMKLVDAQQARRVLDRLVGYELSPFLWQKIARGLSAGRVQSAALRLIVDRERERDNFAPQEYWTIEAELANSKGLDFRARPIQQDGQEIEKLDINNKKSAEEIKNALVDADWSVKTVNKKERRLNPPPPFRTSTLQQEAWRKLKFSAKQTMLLAQQLYEGVEIDGAAVGLITYMRTDSSNLAEEFLNSTQKFVAETLGPQYVQGSRRFAGKTKGAQEAHEAIRPTSPFHAPDSLKGKLDARQWKLYDMIWRRTVASQLPQAIFDTTSVDISATAKKSEYVFRANGSVLQFDGFLKVWPIKSDDEQLPELEVDEKLKYIDLITEQHFTEPPPRYTEASLIKALEENGIGRPSTYAPIISTLQGRNYVEKDEARRLKPTEIGLMVNDIIVANFPEIVDLKFTATMEEDLDKIAGGKMAWVPVIKEFYDPFSKHLAN